MSKGLSEKTHTGEFKQKAVEDMRKQIGPK